MQQLVFQSSILSHRPTKFSVRACHPCAGALRPSQLFPRLTLYSLTASTYIFKVSKIRGWCSYVTALPLFLAENKKPRLSIFLLILSHKLPIMVFPRPKAPWHRGLSSSLDRLRSSVTAACLTSAAHHWLVFGSEASSRAVHH